MPAIAYFALKTGAEREMHTYGGGNGISAGDIIRSSAGLRVSTVDVMPLRCVGHFYQARHQGVTLQKASHHSLSAVTWTKRSIRSVNNPLFFHNTDWDFLLRTDRCIIQYRFMHIIKLPHRHKSSCTIRTFRFVLPRHLHSIFESASV